MKKKGEANVAHKKIEPLGSGKSKEKRTFPQKKKEDAKKDRKDP